MREKLAQQLREELLREGAALVGFANLANVEDAALPFGISMAVALPPDVVEEIQTGPTARYYETYKAYNEKLGALGTYAANFLQAAGYSAKVQAATIKVTSGSLSSPLPHKTVATKAGLGWIGRTALLVTPEYGSAVRLGTVLTDMPLPCAEPVTASSCGSCTACVTHCPAGAATGNLWQPGMQREDLFDANLCQQTARRLSMESFGEAITICGRCFAVCPHTHRYLSAAKA